MSPFHTIFSTCQWWLPDDFDNFCFRASKLADESNGAPLFTVTVSRRSSRQVAGNDVSVDSARFLEEDDASVMEPVNDAVAGAHEDDWQLL